MKLNKTEKMLLEAIDSMLNQSANLGLSLDDSDSDDNPNSIERGYQHLYEQIRDMFQLKSIDLAHKDGVNQAFNKVHSYKYLDDPSFATAMKKEMTAQGIPSEEMSQALGFIPEIIKELRGSSDDWAEKDSGLNKNLEEITDIPDSLGEFEIEEVDDFDMDTNVESESGNASPGHMGKD